MKIDQAEKHEFEEVVVLRRWNDVLWTMLMLNGAIIPGRTSPL